MGFLFLFTAVRTRSLHDAHGSSKTPRGSVAGMECTASHDYIRPILCCNGDQLFRKRSEVTHIVLEAIGGNSVLILPAQSACFPTTTALRDPNVTLDCTRDVLPRRL